MTKCGKGCMPECEYFTTGGCVSPFNCPYKVENESITTATSTPCNLYPLETDKDEEISRLKAENAELRATLSKMETVEKELRERLEKAVELPVKVGDTVYCIRNCGTGRYRVEEHTVTEIVFEHDNQMRIKTSYGLFGCEKWTFGLDCFADNAAAEARLKELKEKNDD